jgi:hypothetical protein
MLLSSVMFGKITVSLAVGTRAFCSNRTIARDALLRYQYAERKSVSAGLLCKQNLLCHIA